MQNISKILSNQFSIKRLFQQSSCSFIPKPLIDGEYGITPKLSIPDHITKTRYQTGEEKIFGYLRGEPEVHSKETLQKLREVGKINAEAAEYLEEIVKVGMTTDEIDKKFHNFALSKNIAPGTFGWHGFPKSLCISVNDMCNHGVPNLRPLQNGDWLNCDFTLYKNGVFGDCSVTIQIGEVDPIVKKVIDVCQKALYAAIKITKPGVPYKKLGETIENVAKQNGCWVAGNITGHGIGSYIYQPPLIFHKKNNAKEIMKEGHAFCLEPVILHGTKPKKIILWKDKQTTQCVGVPSAQWEHTIEVTKDGYEVLTKRSNEVIN